eukprot:CAMPEP_0176395938 /NCGR_PEP_ID=MMETSP0126-20121128/43815_1 /TAXON_ID=141414 ORGANISM="Strombidinopsis acuminatum, Strain SPMC142" /NCGR_SAMPLE_ID=MMETSP0126 /ASSEMBLY_ACC=CAM_ASM_000229 /LENGTH=34 /DNA_ID= /DNA_START= /DNA_END= /DNA_ORIENTATION=
MKHVDDEACDYRKIEKASKVEKEQQVNDFIERQQ